MYHVKEDDPQGKKVEFSNNISFSGTNVLKEWYAACVKYPSLSFWADRAHPEWNRRIDTYYSVIYQAAMGLIPREYLIARGKELEDNAQRLIQDYILSGMPEVSIDDKINYAKVVFRAEEITDDLKGDTQESPKGVCSPQEAWEFDP